MDPITVTHLVQDRTNDLQRTADQVRQERALRSTAAAAAEPAAEPTSSAPAGPIEPRLASVPASARADVAGCDLAEPAA
ncbi:MAG TPA: hypothetical protein VM408_06415 [Methylomirabilota bacterium]|nr:hypothetical protein [Methylomirabilota bacterium]